VVYYSLGCFNDEVQLTKGRPPMGLKNNKSMRKAMKALFVFWLAVALTTAPVAYSQTVDTQADILKAATEWMNAYNNKDATAVAKLYSTDAVVSSPGWTATGRAAIEDGLKKDMTAGSFSRVTSITVDQSHRVGDLVYAMGAWSAVMNQGGKDVAVNGHWLSVSQFHDGKYSMMMHNMNIALPSPQK
jgi:ketosteroid isomerase-like protein